MHTEAVEPARPRKLLVGRRRRIVFLLAALVGAIGLSEAQESTFVLAIHGGAGVRPAVDFEEDPELEKAYRDTLKESLLAGYAVLKGGGSSIEAIEAAILIMEDSPLFNAGKGASYTRDGTVELDASMMDGKTMRAGAVAAIRHVKNPISIARMVLEQTPHVLLAGEGAVAFAQEMGVPWVAESYYYTERKWQDLIDRLENEIPYGTQRRRPLSDPDDPGLYGTVGAVALDAEGNLAAATSTGGRITKRPGRVGDSPIIGASTYANNEICAVSTTGLGEKHMVLLTAKEISSLMAYKGMSVEEAANHTVKEQLVELGGGGGAIVVDSKGNLAMPYTRNGMYRGWVRQDGVTEVRIAER